MSSSNKGKVAVGIFVVLVLLSANQSKQNMNYSNRNNYVDDSSSGYQVENNEDNQDTYADEE